MPAQNHAYFLSLAVENFRCFGPKQTLDLSDSHEKPALWNVLLGENGTGKTTLLRALFAFHLRVYGLNPDLREFAYRWQPGISLSPEWMRWLSIQMGRFSGKYWTSRDQHPLLFFHRDPSSVGENQPSITSGAATFCCAYGVSRRPGPDDPDNDTHIGATLFNPRSWLLSAESWLEKADHAAKIDASGQKRLDATKKLLCALLPDVTDFRLTLDDRHRPLAEAQTPFGWVAVRDLSDGYQAAMAWVVDFASRLQDEYPDSQNPFTEPAVCLVDEIDLHLHPRWQRQMVQTLRTLFPKTQFVVTTHSPLIVQAARDANLALLRRDGDHIVIENDVDYIRRWRVDQILSSDLFSGVGGYPPDVQDLLDERWKILEKSRLTRADEKRVEAIDAALEKLPSGSRPEDQRAMDIIREAAKLLESDLAK